MNRWEKHLLKRERRLIRFQFRAIQNLIGVGLFVLIFTWIFPGFFPYPYFAWGGFESVMRFWPVLILPTLVFILSLFVEERFFKRVGPSTSRELFLMGLWTSVVAGIWEELGFRWLYICITMIIIYGINWIFGFGVGWGVAIVAAVFLALALLDKEYGWAALAGAVVALALYFAFYADPFYWLESFLVWVIHYTTFFQMDNILYNGHDPLFIFGVVFANGWFRDGHKYQGPVGYINSWYFGMAMIYAMMTYGLFTAIVVHALYDIWVDTAQFASREIQNSKRQRFS